MSIIIMILLLSLLILVHEAGHFLVARAFGIKVDKFGFGLPIGPTLFQKQVGDVTILIHAFLLGGYVSFPDDEKDCKLPIDSNERFLNKPAYQRACVFAAGVTANVICAYLLVLFVAFHWGYLPAGRYDVYVNGFTENCTKSLKKSGMKKGDKIVKINDTKITNTGSILTIISNSKPNDGYYTEDTYKQILYQLDEVNIAYSTDEVIPLGVTIFLPKEKLYEPPVNLNKESEMGITQYKAKNIALNEYQVKIRNRLNSKKYKDKGYIVGDDKFTLNDVAKALSDTEKPLIFEVKRDGKNLRLKPCYTDDNGKIGIELAQKGIMQQTKGVKHVLKYGTKYLWDNTYNMVYGLGQIFTGKVQFKDLHGIVAITKMGGDIIEDSGMFYGLLLTAIISMDLAIVNFLPIPALDGGHFLLLIIEKIRGKRLNEEVEEKIGTFFFILLIILMVLVIFNDIIWLKG